MKRVACIVLLLGGQTLAFAQATQQCIVKQYNQRKPKTPLSGVIVIAKGSNTGVSTDDGKVTLTFNTLKPGDRICDVVAIKDGYEIYNKEVVENWIISRIQSAFELIMVRSDYFSQYKAKLTQVSQENYQKKYEQAKRELQQSREAGKLKEEELLKKYQELDERYHKLLQSLNSHVDQLARIDLSAITAEEQRIVGMVQEGKIDEAVEAYANMKLVEKTNAEVRSYKAFKDEEERMHDETIRSKRNIDEAYDAMQRWVSTLLLDNKEHEAEEVLDSLLSIITPLYEEYPDEYRPKVAKLHYQLGQYALEDYLGERYDEAENHFHLAEKEYLILTDQNPEKYRSDLAQAQEGIGLALTETDDIEGAEQHYFDAMNNWSLMVDHHPDNPAYLGGLAHMQHLLGKLYLDMYQNEVFGILLNEDKDTTSTNVNRILNIKSKAESLFASAFDNYNSTISYNPDKYRLELAKAQRDLGWFYMLFQEYTKSEDVLTALIHNMEEALANNDSAIFVKTMADAQQLLANEVYRCLGEKEKREVCLLAALENCFRHLTSSPDEIAWPYQCVFDDLCAFYYKDPEKAESFLKNTLDRINHLCNDGVNNRILLLKTHVEDKYFNHLKRSNNVSQIEKICEERLNFYIPQFLQNPEQYQERISYYYRKLRDVYGYKKDFIERHTQTYLEEIELWTKLYEQNPDKYRKNLCDLYLFTGEYLRLVKETDKAKEYYEKGMELLDGSMLADVDLSLLQERAILLEELGRNSKRFLERENYYLSALECYTSLYQQDPKRYLDDWLLMHERLGKMYFNQSIFNKAEEHFKAAFGKRLEHFNSIPFSSDRVWDTLQDLDLTYRSQKDYYKSEKLWLDFAKNCDSLSANLRKWGKKDMYDVLEKAYTQLGALYSDYKDYPKAIKTYTTILGKATLLYKKDRDGYRKNLASLQDIIGSVYLQNKEYHNSIQHFLEAKELYEIYPDSHSNELAHLQEELGIAYWQLYKIDRSSLDKAEACLQNASARYYSLWQRDFGQLEESPFKEKYIHIQLLLGDFYYEISNRQKAKKHYFRVLEYQEKNGNSKDLKKKMRERGLLENSQYNE